MTIRFGLDVAQQRMPFDEVVVRTRLAERLGFDGMWGFDHFVPMYGEGPGECFDGMTTLAALSAHTSSIRLGLLVTGVTYRHPSIFANQAMTIDHASHGRLNLALGAAWYGPEHEQLGLAFPSVGERFDLLEDTLEIVTRLFTGERVSYDGRRVSLDGAQLRPLPVQRPRPPIWIGGQGPRRTLPLVARFALQFHPPTGFLRDFVVEHSGERRGQLDIKHGGMIPIVDLARWAGMAAGAASCSTVDRLRAAEAAGTLDSPDARTLIEAFGFIFSLRLDHQVEQLRRGEAPDDFIDPKTLNPLARSYLREAFRAVASVQSGLAAELSMGIRWG